jgi:hypothetical protein
VTDKPKEKTMSEFLSGGLSNMRATFDPEKSPAFK